MNSVLNRLSALWARLQNVYHRWLKHAYGSPNQAGVRRIRPAWMYALVISLMLLYVPAFALLYPVIGDSATALVCVPAVPAAWLFGRRWVLPISLLITGMTLAIILTLFPPNSVLTQLIKAGIGMVLLYALGWFTGWTSETQIQLQLELANRRQMEMALRESDQRYRMLFNETNEAILIHDLRGRLLNINETAARRLGYSVEEMLAMTLDRIDRTSAALPGSSASRELEEKGRLLFESEFTRRDGSTFPVEVNAHRILYNDQPAVLSVARDITSRKQIEQSEKEQRAMADALREITGNLTSTLQLEEVLDGILNNLGRVVEHDAVTIMLVEGPWARITRQRGYAERGFNRPAEINRFFIEDLYTLRWLNQNQQPLVISDTSKDPVWISFPATEWVGSYAGAPITMKGETIGFLNLDSSRPGFYEKIHGERLQAFADQTAVAIQNARLYAAVQRQAVVDALTGLYNRRGLAELGQREVERAIRYKRPVAALMLDIDQFKQFNDQYSYAVGDEVLSILAARIKNAVRKEDLICRYGGDEFVILLVENNLETAHHVAEHVRQNIGRQPFRTEKGNFPVTISIGVAAQTANELNLNRLIEDAGQRLQMAKQSGRNQVYSGTTL